jgi:hypothetical protein
MRIYIDQHEATILDLALMTFKQTYPETFGSECDALREKLLLCIEMQRSGNGYESPNN